MKSLNHVRTPAVLALLLMCALIAPAQWDKKPYTQWSERDAQKLLNDSPWAKTQTFVGSIPGQPLNTFQVDFHIRFFSAKPVRQATSRVLELKQKGNVSQEFAAKLQNLINSSFNDYILITIVCDAQQHNALQDALMLLQNHTTASLQGNTYLEVKGQKVYLQQYQAPRNDDFGARFIFPRRVNGEPFITPATEEIHFYSELSSGSSAPPVATRRPGSPTSSSDPPIYTINQRFKVSAMNFEGKLEY